MDKWHYRFLDLAYVISTWSKDPSTKCGAVITRPDKTVASVGFNGFPKNVTDDEAHYNTREEKYSRVIHAEMNAILHSRENLAGYGIYSTGPTCDRCAAHIIQAGITLVAFPEFGDQFEDRWADSIQRSKDMYKDANIKVINL